MFLNPEFWLNTGAIKSATEGVISFSTVHSDGVLLASAGVFAVCAIWVGTRWSRRNGVDKMAQRKAYLDRLTADVIGDGLFDLFYEDKISRQEYRALCKKLGVKLGLTDLLPVRRHPKAIEHRVKRNIKTMKLLDANGQPIRPSVPGPKPAEVVPFPTTPRTKSNRWVSKGKILLRRHVA